jgi:hypothetical protein
MSAGSPKTQPALRRHCSCASIKLQVSDSGVVSSVSPVWQTLAHKIVQSHNPHHGQPWKSHGRHWIPSWKRIRWCPSSAWSQVSFGRSRSLRIWPIVCHSQKEETMTYMVSQLSCRLREAMSWQTRICIRFQISRGERAKWWWRAVVRTADCNLPSTQPAESAFCVDHTECEAAVSSIRNGRKVSQISRCCEWV